jgi:hypothetical protein
MTKKKPPNNLESGFGIFSKTQNPAENAVFGAKLHFGKKR